MEIETAFQVVHAGSARRLRRAKQAPQTHGAEMPAGRKPLMGEVAVDFRGRQIDVGKHDDAAFRLLQHLRPARLVAGIEPFAADQSQFFEQGDQPGEVAAAAAVRMMVVVAPTQAQGVLPRSRNFAARLRRVQYPRSAAKNRSAAESCAEIGHRRAHPAPCVGETLFVVREAPSPPERLPDIPRAADLPRRPLLPLPAAVTMRLTTHSWPPEQLPMRAFRSCSHGSPSIRTSSSKRAAARKSATHSTFHRQSPLGCEWTITGGVAARGCRQTRSPPSSQAKTGLLQPRLPAPRRRGPSGDRPSRSAACPFSAARSRPVWRRRPSVDKTRPRVAPPRPPPPAAVAKRRGRKMRDDG